MVNILNITPQRGYWGVIKIIRIYLCSVVIVLIWGYGNPFVGSDRAQKYLGAKPVIQM